MMKHYLRVFNLVILSSTFFIGCLTNHVWAMPADEMVRELNAQVLRVQVKHNNGSHGFGSAVVIAKDQVVTNCHVVTDARDVEVMVNGVAHVATAIKPDWHHDLCVLTVEHLDAPIAKMGASENLKYETAVFTVGYPDKATEPVNTFGVVKGMFPMDDSVVIRATSPFRLGASGGGVFDESGTLVGIITLKSRGNQAQYFYMPVEWVQALMNRPAQVLGMKSEKPFWAASEEKRPYFMQVVQPFVSKDWKSLLTVSKAWVATEPDAAESWFYLAAAEYETKAYDKAEDHFKKALSLNSEHRQAIEYLNKIAEKTARANVALNQLALLTD
ncbi:MAG: trypsin-like peptidase domain-containing protein [Methylotenera sp.]|nr:trypsin-like peptidase domain-containing protein [Methylotenera sp.]MDO9233480.1 trypsin-like peptidase domain-containing protein [Methylotenera sp.]MDO9389121.1 trypsin-like peptidase domain-containing protein [Methylotenera sp.]MDP2102865.1 trypsin-like peptidase domain-containing protein [Methylotenera sp.]MDP2282047.1 trypsin-like peptidase domain-containing protein [Methylotenera sp.]